MKRYITRINGFADKELKCRQDEVCEAACSSGWREMALYVYANAEESRESRSARLDGIIAGISAGDIVLLQLPTGNGPKWEQELVSHIKAYGGRVIPFLHGMSAPETLNKAETPESILYICKYQEAVIVKSLEERNRLRAMGLEKSVKIFVCEKEEEENGEGFLTQEYYICKVLNLAVEAILKKDEGLYVLLERHAIRTEKIGAFAYAAVRESYRSAHAVSFLFTGEYDWISVLSDQGRTLWETEDSGCHYALIPAEDTCEHYVVKAYVQTLKGKMAIAESERLCLSEPAGSGEPPVISVIIPLYNGETTVARALDCILAQSQPGIEIICVDDESKDRTAEIVGWYAERYPSVHLFRKENGGAAAARNFGIGQARGSYVGFMDDDDFLPVNSCEVLYTALKKTDADIAFGNVLRQNRTSRIMSKRYALESDTPLRPEEYLRAHITDMGNVIWNKLYRAELCREHCFGPRVYEDAAWTPLVFSYAETICYVDEVVYEWDQTDENTEGQRIGRMSSQKRAEYYGEAIRYYMDRCKPERRQFLKEATIRNYSVHLASMPELQAVLDEIRENY